MKKITATIAFLSCLTYADQVHANLFDPYLGLGIQVGNTIALGEHNESLSELKGSYSAFIGMNLPLIRGEIEYNYITAKDKGWNDDLTMHNVMLNGYIKPFAIPFIKPYIGAGAGVIIAGNAPENIDINTAASFQGMIGVSLDIPAIPVGLDVEYRALYGVDVIAAPLENDDYDTLSHGVRAKIRYSF